MIYKIKPKTIAAINTFYNNTSKKYFHTYSAELKWKNINEAISGMYGIEKCLPRRRPTITRWSNYWMARSGKWYYAYTLTKDCLGNDVVTVVDACHGQNMHEQILHAHVRQLLESLNNLSADSERRPQLTTGKFRKLLTTCVSACLRDML